MTHEQHRSPLPFAHILHLANSFLLEFGIAYGEDFVHDEDFRLQERSDSKTETDGHTGAVTLNRRIDVFLTAGEIDDLIELAVNLLLGHTEDSAVHIDILPTRHLAMETCADLEQAGDTSACTDGTDGGSGNFAQQLEQRRYQ